MLKLFDDGTVMLVFLYISRNREIAMNIPKSITASQMKKLVSLLTGVIPSDLPSELAKRLIDNRRDLEKTLKKILLNKIDNPEIAGINWSVVYDLLDMQKEYKFFNGNFDYVKGGTEWTIPVIKGITCKKIILCLKKLGVNIKKYIRNPDIEVDRNERDSNETGSYPINIRRAIEADEENRNLSSDDLKKRGIKGITLLERLLLELGYFSSTGQHLDTESVTLCAGSLHKSGDIPRVCFRSGALRIFICWCGSRDQCDHLRPRSVTKLKELL